MSAPPVIEADTPEQLIYIYIYTCKLILTSIHSAVISAEFDIQRTVHRDIFL